MFHNFVTTSHTYFKGHCQNVTHKWVQFSLVTEL